jgi:4-hydroxybenzoate polyprenyltransferase
MIYLCLIFIPPLYFLIRQKWLGFILNSILYGIACLCALSMIGIWIAPFFWILAVGHACFTYRKEASAQHADMVATKMAEKMAATLRENKNS